LPKAVLKNTAIIDPSTETSQSETNGTDDDSGGEEAGAAFGSRRPLVELLSNSKKVMAAMLGMYDKPYGDASADAKELWKFVYCDAVKAVLSKKDKDDVYAVGVTKERIMERVTVSDEAMVMTILLVKIDETLAEEGSIGVSTFTPDDDASTSTSRTSKRRKGQGKGGGRKKRRTDGRNKKVPMNAGCGVDPELGRNGKIFQRMRAKVLKARENGDGLGWYQAIVEEITKIKRQEKAMGKMLLDYGTSGSVGSIPILCNLASDDDDNVEDGEFSKCPYAAACLEEETRRARALGLFESV
jgi:hypothetical protein